MCVLTEVSPTLNPSKTVNSLQNYPELVRRVKDFSKVGLKTKNEIFAKTVPIFLEIYETEKHKKYIAAAKLR